jgi:hypothetical protein
MPTVKRNILLKILIILISITLFGFQNVPVDVDPGLVEANGSWSPGYVELLIYGQGGSGSGASSANFVWHPVNVFLPITGFDSRGNGMFQGGAYTGARGNYRQGPIVGFTGWPVYWKIQGHVTLPPDCAIEMKIDETWYPGHSITCEPTGIVGCISEKWEPDFHPGVMFKIPFDRAWGSPKPSTGVNGMPIHITTIVTSIVFGAELSGGIQPLGCESNLWFPVIPQAP